jgi:hypothetical protein
MRSRAVARLVGPHATSARRLAVELGISEATLSRWRQAAAIIPDMPPRTRAPSTSTTTPAAVVAATPRARTAREKVVIAVRAAELQGQELGEFLRREGVHQAEVEAWMTGAESGVTEARKPLPPSKELRKLKAEIARKDKALAETAALLVLQKKVAAIWGGEGDDTEDSSE